MPKRNPSSLARLLGLEALPAAWRARMAGAAVVLSALILVALTVYLIKPLATMPPVTVRSATMTSATMPLAVVPSATEILVSVKELATGDPVAGAVVKIRGTNFDADQVTDTAGEARLPRKENAEWLQVAVSGQDWVPMSATWRATVDDATVPRKFDFVMERPTTIGGVVVDEKGDPLPGAKVMMDVGKKYPAGGQNVAVQFKEVTADGEGRWSYSGVPAKFDSIDLAAAHPECLGEYGFYPLAKFADLAALHTGTAKLVLKRGTPIDILVRGPDGQPVNFATVGYGKDRVASNGMPEFPVHEDGSLRLGVPAGFEAVITVKAAGLAPELKRVRAGPAPVKVTFDLQFPQTLSGQVVDQAGKPVPDAMVFVDTWRDARTLLEELRTDDQGRFTWTGAPADEILVGVSADGFASTRDVRVKAGAANILTLPPLTHFTGMVADGATGAPVKASRVIDGIDYRDGSPPSWNGAGPATVKPTAKAGEFTIAFDDAYYPAMIVRVEADGYMPALSTSIPLDGKSTNFTFKLEKGAMIEGTLLGAGGRPVAGADVFLAVKGQTLDIVDEGLIDQRELQSAKTDNAGHFKFVPQKNPYVMAVLTDEGYALSVQADFEKAHTLALQPWARLEGDVRLGTRPAAGVPVTINMSPPAPFNDYGQEPPAGVFVSAYTRLTTDTAGHFAAARVMPGSVGVERDTPHSGPYSWSNGSAVEVETQASQTSHVTVGGVGRPITGRVLLPKEFRPDGAAPRDSVSLELIPELPDWSPPAEVFDMAPAEWQAWRRKWDASDEGQRITKARDDADRVSILRMQNAQLNPDGTFRLEEVRAGHYALAISLAAPDGAPRTAGMAVMLDFTVPPVPGGVTDDVLDVGALTPEPAAPPAVGDAVPAFTVNLADGKAVSLADFKGKYLLIHVWRTELNVFLPELSALTPVWDAYKNDPRLAMLGISYDLTPLPPRTYANAKAIPWPQALAIGRTTRIPSMFPLRQQSLAWLIGPDGKVLAANLRGEQVKAAVDQALGK